MKISGIWVQIVLAIVPAVLAILKLPEPFNEIIQKIIDALLNNLQVSGLAALSVGTIGYGLWKYQPRTKEEVAAERFSAAKAELESSAATAGVDIGNELGALTATANKQFSGVCHRAREAAAKNED